MNFGQLKSLLLAQARSDAPALVSNAGTWINLAQLRVCRDQPPGGWWFTERVETLTVGGDGNVVLSKTPLQVREVFAGATRLLKVQSTDSSLFATASDTSAFYTSGTTVVLLPPALPGTSIKVIYDVALPDLVNDTDSNALTEVFPDIIISGAMVDVSLHLGRVGDVQVWEGRYRQQLKELQDLNYRRRGRLVGDV